MTVIRISNQSSLCSDADIGAMLHSLQTQISRDFAPHWGTDATLVFGPDVKPSEWRVTIKDDADQPGDLGYHLLDGIIPEAFIFARPTLSDGETISSVLSHELLEMLADPYTSRMAPDRSHIIEVCDPVEQQSYYIENTVVSDFVFPSYFGLGSASGSPFDFNNQLQGGCPELMPGGYIMWWDGQKWNSKFGRKSDGTIPYHALRPGRSLWRAKASP